MGTENKHDIIKKLYPFKIIPYYGTYVLCMFHLAHEYKRLEWEKFKKEYSGVKFKHNLEQRYLLGYLEYLSNINNDHMDVTMLK